VVVIYVTKLKALREFYVGHATSAPADLPGSGPGPVGFCHFERLTWIEPGLGSVWIQNYRSKYLQIQSATGDNN